MSHDKIIIKGAKENNLKNIDVEILQVFRVRENLHWHLTQFMQRVKEDTLSLSRLMPACF